MNWLLDTCALSEYIKKSPADEVIRWLDEQPESTLFISVTCLGEIEKGINKLHHCVQSVGRVIQPIGQLYLTT